MIMISIFKAVGLSFLSIVLCFFIVKIIFRKNDFNLWHGILTILSFVLSVILLSLFFYSKSIVTLVETIHDNANNLLTTNEQLINNIISNSSSTNSIDYQYIKNQLSAEYPLLKSKIESVSIQTNLPPTAICDKFTAIEFIKESVTSCFNGIYHRLKFIMKMALICMLAIQIIYLILLTIIGSTPQRNYNSAASHSRKPAYRERGKKRHY